MSTSVVIHVTYQMQPRAGHGRLDHVPLGRAGPCGQHVAHEEVNSPLFRPAFSQRSLPGGSKAQHGEVLPPVIASSNPIQAAPCLGESVCCPVPGSLRSGSCRQSLGHTRQCSSLPGLVVCHLAPKQTPLSPMAALVLLCIAGSLLGASAQPYANPTKQCAACSLAAAFSLMTAGSSVAY